MGWSVYLWKCENIIIPHNLVKIHHVETPPPLFGQTAWFWKCCSCTTTYSWTFIKSQSVVSRGMDHSWLIFPSVIVGSNYNIIEKLLWCLGYTLDCKNQTSEDQWQHNLNCKLPKKFPFVRTETMCCLVAAADWWSSHFINIDWTVQYIWVNVTYFKQSGYFYSEPYAKSTTVQKPATLNYNEEGQCPDVKSCWATSQL